MCLHPLAKNAAARYIPDMTPRDGYPSDLPDDRWALIEPVLTARQMRHRQHALGFGRPPAHDLRRLLDAVLYVDRTGVP